MYGFCCAAVTTRNDFRVLGQTVVAFCLVTRLEAIRVQVNKVVGDGTFIAQHLHEGSLACGRATAHDIDDWLSGRRLLAFKPLVNQPLA